jgi:hypothetical protein
MTHRMRVSEDEIARIIRWIQRQLDISLPDVLRR